MAEQLRPPNVVLTTTSNTSINIYCDTPTYPIGMIPPIPDGSIIQRSNTSDFTASAEVYNGTDVSFDDTGLTNGNTYYYRAKFKGDGTNTTDSEWSDVENKTLALGTKLATPGITINSVYGGTIEFTVENVTNGLRGEVWRSTSSDFSTGAWFLVEGPLPIHWYDWGISPNTTYYYRARALGHDDIYYTSDWGTASATTPNQLQAPLLSSDGRTDHSIDVTISPVSGGSTYRLERSLTYDFSIADVIYTGFAGEFVDTNLESYTTYYYRAKALANGSFSDSEYSPPFGLVTDSTFQSLGVKYRMNFKDDKSKSFNVSLFFYGWEGGVTDLTGSDIPVSISYNGDDDGKDLVIDFKAVLNIMTPKFNEGFYDDVTSIEDQQCWIEIVDMSGFKYSGWLIPDESERSFDEVIYEISLKVVSPLSIMKGKDLVYDNGIMLFGSYLFSDLINRCLLLSTPEGAAYTVESELRELSYSGTGDLFEQIKVNIEGFNDENGRPPKCYDVIDKICNSFDLYCIWEDGKLKFIDQYNNSRSPKDIKIKEIGDNTDFLIGNSEVITKTRGVKELSLKYNYGSQIGLLPNGRFIDFDQTTGLFNNWTYGSLYANSSVSKTLNRYNVIKVGTGRPVSPYSVRFLGELSDYEYWVNPNTEPLIQGFHNQFTLNKGDRIKVKLRYRYLDWKYKYGVETLEDNRVPYLFIHMFIIPPDNDKYKTWYVSDQKDIAGTNIQGDRGVNITPTPSLWPVNVVTSLNADRITIAVDSTPEIQMYESEFVWPFDAGYRLWFSIFGFKWWRGKPVDIEDKDLFIDIVDVVLTITADTPGTESIGEQIYISQKTTASKIEEPEEKFFGNFPSPYVAGSILNTEGDVSAGFSRGEINDTLQNWIARSRIALRRSQRSKIDASVRSNTLRMSDQIAFKYAGNNILPNKYFIGRYDYDIKQCEVRVTAFEMNTEDKPYKVASEEFQVPTDENDMLENYKTYS